MTSISYYSTWTCPRIAKQVPMLLAFFLTSSQLLTFVVVSPAWMIDISMLHWGPLCVLFFESEQPASSSQAWWCLLATCWFMDLPHIQAIWYDLVFLGITYMPHDCTISFCALNLPPLFLTITHMGCVFASNVRCCVCPALGMLVSPCLILLIHLSSLLSGNVICFCLLGCNMDMYCECRSGVFCTWICPISCYFCLAHTFNWCVLLSRLVLPPAFWASCCLNSSHSVSSLSSCNFFKLAVSFETFWPDFCGFTASLFIV